MFLQINLYIVIILTLNDLDCTYADWGCYWRYTEENQRASGCYIPRTTWSQNPSNGAARSFRYFLSLLKINIISHSGHNICVTLKAVFDMIETFILIFLIWNYRFNFCDLYSCNFFLFLKRYHGQSRTVWSGLRVSFWPGRSKQKPW